MSVKFSDISIIVKYVDIQLQLSFHLEIASPLSQKKPRQNLSHRGGVHLKTRTLYFHLLWEAYFIHLHAQEKLYTWQIKNNF